MRGARGEAAGIGWMGLCYGCLLAVLASSEQWPGTKEDGERMSETAAVARQNKPREGCDCEWWTGDDGRSGPCTPFISETASSKSLQLCQEARALPTQQGRSGRSWWKPIKFPCTKLFWFVFQILFPSFKTPKFSNEALTSQQVAGYYRWWLTNTAKHLNV